MLQTDWPLSHFTEDNNDQCVSVFSCVFVKPFAYFEWYTNSLITMIVAALKLHGK